MNQDKIGKLIAKKRKEKGLTQRELGDLVGVGYRAVSKWETGLTMPDISIINDLSNILGITSDELLKGELNTKGNITNNKVDFNKRYLLLIIPVILIVVVTVILFNWHNDDMDVASVGADDAAEGIVYDLARVSTDYSIDGKVTFTNRYMTIYVSNFSFDDYNFNHMVINGCQYELFYNDEFVYGYVFSENMKNLEFPINVMDFVKDLKISYSIDSSSALMNDDTDNFLTIKFHFIDEKGKKIDRIIETKLVHR